LAAAVQVRPALQMALLVPIPHLAQSLRLAVDMAVIKPMLVAMAVLGVVVAVKVVAVALEILQAYLHRKVAMVGQVLVIPVGAAAALVKQGIQAVLAQEEMALLHPFQAAA
jgi:uncharacterized membrane protein